MLDVLRVRDFRLLWTARTVSLVGTWLLVVPIPAHVLALTGSLTATGLVLAAEFLPSVLLGPIAGVLVDRWDRRRVMLFTDLGRALAVALLLFVRDAGDIWLVYLAMVLESVGTVLFRPAAQAHTPVVVGPRIGAANSLNALSDGMVRLVAAPLGAILYGLAGYTVLVWVDIASYLVSTAAILATTRLVGRGVGGSLRAVFTELADGLRFLRASRTASMLLLVSSVFVAANACLSALIVPFGVLKLGGKEEVGFVMSALGVGFLLGAPLIGKLIDRVRPSVLLGVGLTATSIGFLLLFSSRSLVGALPSAVVIGVFGSMVLVTAQTTMQRATPNAVLGRVSAVFLTGEAVATLAGALLGPAIAGQTSLLTAAYAACAMTLVAGVLGFALIPAR